MDEDVHAGMVLLYDSEVFSGLSSKGETVASMLEVRDAGHAGK